MTASQALAFGILAATLILFVWGRWRYDVVAVFALLAVTLTGLAPATSAFSGFAHPAVITVAAVLVISRGLHNAGIIDVVMKAISPLRGRENLQIAAQCAVIAILSSFMNNVGALAIMLPVALRNAYRDNYSPAKVLMPLAFSSLLGGMITLIGTPPNIIIATFRNGHGGTSFEMFDFAYVGLPVAVAGLIFLLTVGWRLLSLEGRKTGGGDAFTIAGYTAEVSVPESARAVGMTVTEIEELAEDDVTVVSIIRSQTRRLAPAGFQRIRAGDVLVLRGDTNALKAVIDEAKVELVGEADIRRDDLESDEVVVVEAVVGTDSRLIGMTPVRARLRSIHGVNLLALARQGQRIYERLGHAAFRPGDVVLLQMPAERVNETLAELGCLPLADRGVGIGRKRRLVLAGGLFAAAIGATMAGFVPAHLAFFAAAAAYVMLDIVKPNEVYTAIDWPVIVMLAAMFPLGTALETTGATALVVDTILRVSEGLSLVWVLLILFVGTMFISDVINNSATAVLMAPIGVSLAARLGVSPDPFLIAIAIGASSAFLTPIGHQCNTIVMEPGGYRFGDYWRVGLPLEILIVAIAIPLILLFWPP